MDFNFHQKRTMSSKPILTYLDIPGLAESTRLAFAFGNVDFEDRRVDHATVASLREEGGRSFGETSLFYK